MSMAELVNRCVDAAIAVPDHDELGPDYNAIVRAVLAEAGVDELVAAAKRSLQGWENAVELGLIPHRHTNTATILADELRAALAKIGANQ